VTLFHPPQYPCHYPNCDRGSHAQLRGENLCSVHLELRLQQSRDRADAMFEQHCIDQRRIKAAAAWSQGYKVCLI